MATKTESRISGRQLYFISFIEGGVVMVTEIAGAKLLAPYFGASLYSWAATLAITLLALMCGYYYGGYLSSKPRFHERDSVTWMFFLSGISVLVMPAVAHLILQRTLGFSFFTGLILSQLCFLFIPIFLMGMISPMIVCRITKKAEQSGRAAGNIYALSTCGGIVFTLLFGFYIIPRYGISVPVRLLGLFVVAFAILVLVKKKTESTRLPLAFSLTALGIIMGFGWTKALLLKDNQVLLECSEGLLGELAVTDELVYAPDGSKVKVRKLKVNNVQQNYVFADAPGQSLMQYVSLMRQIVLGLPGNRSALLVGLGAGSLHGVLCSRYADVESAEIDARVFRLGKRYFGLQDQGKHHITDGRYFLNTTKKKYDLIILDVILGESLPAQLITLECFKRCHALLSDEGTLLLEHGGIADFRHNSLVPDMVATLKEAGFYVSLFNPLPAQNFGDVVVMATKKPFDPSKFLLADDISLKGGVLAQYSLPLTVFNCITAKVITDDANLADFRMREHYQAVRQSIRKELARLKRHTPVR